MNELRKLVADAQKTRGWLAKTAETGWAQQLQDFLSNPHVYGGALGAAGGALVPLVWYLATQNKTEEAKQELWKDVLIGLLLGGAGGAAVPLLFRSQKGKAMVSAPSTSAAATSAPAAPAAPAMPAPKSKSMTIDQYRDANGDLLPIANEQIRLKQQ